MRVFTVKPFARWARKEGVDDALLGKAIEEMESGQIDADLGGQVFKKRIAKPGGGKSGGWRTLLAFRSGDKAFFIYGFAKNAQDNVAAQELKALKVFAKELLGLTAKQLTDALKAGELNEVNTDDTIDS